MIEVKVHTTLKRTVNVVSAPATCEVSVFVAVTTRQHQAGKSSEQPEEHNQRKIPAGAVVGAWVGAGDGEHLMPISAIWMKAGFGPLTDDTSKV